MKSKEKQTDSLNDIIEQQKLVKHDLSIRFDEEISSFEKSRQNMEEKLYQQEAILNQKIEEIDRFKQEIAKLTNNLKHSDNEITKLINNLKHSENVVHDLTQELNSQVNIQFCIQFCK